MSGYLAFDAFASSMDGPVSGSTAFVEVGLGRGPLSTGEGTNAPRREKSMRLAALSAIGLLMACSPPPGNDAGWRDAGSDGGMESGDGGRDSASLAGAVALLRGKTCGYESFSIVAAFGDSMTTKPGWPDIKGGCVVADAAPHPTSSAPVSAGTLTVSDATGAADTLFFSGVHYEDDSSGNPRLHWSAAGSLTVSASGDVFPAFVASIRQPACPDGIAVDGSEPGCSLTLDGEDLHVTWAPGGAGDVVAAFVGSFPDEPGATALAVVCRATVDGSLNVPAALLSQLPMSGIYFVARLSTASASAREAPVTLVAGAGIAGYFQN